MTKNKIEKRFDISDDLVQKYQNAFSGEISLDDFINCIIRVENVIQFERPHDRICYWFVLHQFNLWEDHKLGARKALMELIEMIVAKLCGESYKPENSSYITVNNRFLKFEHENSLSNTRFIDELNPDYWQDRYLKNHCFKAFGKYRSYCETMIPIFKEVLKI